MKTLKQTIIKNKKLLHEYFKFNDVILTIFNCKWRDKHKFLKIIVKFNFWENVVFNIYVCVL